MIAKHAIITDECRRNRTDDGAIKEAVERILREYHECAPHWPIGNGTKFHVKLEIEKSGAPSFAEAPAPDEDELYSRHMAELEANWEVHPIPPEDRDWINGYKQGWLRHRMRSAPALSESEERQK